MEFKVVMYVVSHCHVVQHCNIALHDKLKLHDNVACHAVPHCSDAHVIVQYINRFDFEECQLRVYLPSHLPQTFHSLSAVQHAAAIVQLPVVCYSCYHVLIHAVVIVLLLETSLVLQDYP